MPIEIFIHASGRAPSVAAVEATEKLIDVLEREGIAAEAHADAFVFAGESTDVLIEIEAEDRVDATLPVDKNHTIAELKLGHHHHVHVAHCRHVKVEVHYGVKTKSRTVAPSTTVSTLAAWAHKAFKIDPAIAAEYVLQIFGTTTQPRGDTHIGELTKKPPCAVVFELVKEITPQG